MATRERCWTLRLASTWTATCPDVSGPLAAVIQTGITPGWDLVSARTSDGIFLLDLDWREHLSSSRGRLEIARLVDLTPGVPLVETFVRPRADGLLGADKLGERGPPDGGHLAPWLRCLRGVW